MAKTVPGPVASAGSEGSTRERLPLIFISIVLVEVITIAGLYWFGVHFV